jgi:1-acyl-sn-glycerol-3-phosphate acyltransferase
MDVREAFRTVRQWAPFTARTVAFGTVSLTLGPLTRDRRASLWAMRKWCQSSARALHIDIETTGAENAPVGSPFVYCSNHQSLLDVLVLGAVLSGDFKWAAKHELMKIPFLGWHLQLAGHVPVDRGGGARAAAQVIARFERVLGEGKPLLVFPEGTRSSDGVLQSFKNGGFYAAVRAGVPVVPVALEGTGNLMHKGALDMGEGQRRLVRVRVGKPIEPLREGKEAAKVADLRVRTHAAVSNMLVAIGGRVPPRGSMGRDEPQASASSDR